jgi:hypothetical protein
MSTFKWTQWNDSIGVDVLMRPEVVCFDVVPVAGFSDAWLFDHSLNKCLEVGIIDDSAKVAFEMNNVDQIESC